MINPNEPEGDYCPVCESPVTEHHLNNSTWLECDNPQCGHVIDLTEAQQYEADAKADHFSEEQFPNV